MEIKDHGIVGSILHGSFFFVYILIIIHVPFFMTLSRFKNKAWVVGLNPTNSPSLHVNSNTY